ncbi:PREDICTED: cadherin-23-like [Priapulus caudatus]|uniref:Cadherin-23-like n=1 Tax=Priapulus caudatus TaxID=37621 RepID=A0ABM1DY05_PRICU|nr:PREDICTED: cadherin-23-like [Priapulus caudatus]
MSGSGFAMSQAISICLSSASLVYIRLALCSYDGAPAPVFMDVSEMAPVGEVIGVLRVHGSDTEIQLDQQHISKLVEFIPDTRAIKLIANLHLWVDEIFNSSGGAENYDRVPRIDIGITCTDKRSSSKITTIQVKIDVSDVNNKKPRFINTPYFANISELTPIGYTIFENVKVKDDDYSFPNNFVFFAIEDGPFSEYAEISNQYQGRITLKKHLDFRSFSSFYVTVKAQDSGVPALFTRENLTVGIIDEDNLNPIFTAGPYSAEIEHNTPVGSVIHTSPSPILAVDQDKGIMSPIFYTIEYGSNGYFDIDNTTGGLTLMGPLRRGMHFYMMVKATEARNGDHYATTSLTVTVKRANKNAPIFPHTSYRIDVLENVPVGSTVMKIAAVDDDGDADELTYTIIGGNQSDDFIMTETGELITTKRLNFLRTTAYQFTALVSDGTFSDQCSVRVVVVNVNNRNPVFEHQIYNITANRTGDKYIGSVKASDPTGRRLVYDIVGYKRYFKVTPDGDVIATSHISELIDSRYDLTLTACNEESPQLDEDMRCSVAQLTVFFPTKDKYTDAYVLKAGSERTTIIIALAVLAAVMFVSILILVILLLKQKRLTKLAKDDNATHQSSRIDPQSQLFAVSALGSAPDKKRKPAESIGGTARPYYNNYGGYAATEPGDDVSDQSDRPVDASSTEKLYTQTNKSRTDRPLTETPAGTRGEPIGSTGQRRRQKRVTIGGAEEVDDWGGEHPQADSQVETILDPNVSVEPIYDSEDPPNIARPELTIYF